MSNKNLGSAKAAKNDEFYTRLDDIQNEIEQCLEYDFDIFRDKVVYCNCDDPYESHFFHFFALHFRRLGLKQLITTSYKPSPIANTLLPLFGDDATLPPDKNRPKITANRFIINEVCDMDGDGGVSLKDAALQIRANKNNEWAPLKGNGDFRSEECIELLQQADIVVTNPPFSLFREYVAQLIEYDKKFAIIGNKKAVTYKNIFPLIQENKMWLGATTAGRGKPLFFAVPNGAEITESDRQKAARLGYVEDYTRLGNSCWFTCLDYERRYQPLQFMTMAENKRFNKPIKNNAMAYQKYDNYEAIEVPDPSAIPSDYDGAMGVPVSFLNEYNPDQFEIIGMDRPLIKTLTGKVSRFRINGKEIYTRIVIKYKNPQYCQGIIASNG